MITFLDLSHLAVLIGAWVAFLVSPGPDFATTVYYATTRSRRVGLFVALGITSAFSIWLIGSIVGVSALLIRVSALAAIIRTLGASYLVYLGIKTILHARRAKHESSTDSVLSRCGSGWKVGFLCNITNPKAAAFFSSLFAVLWPPNLPLWVQGATLVLLLVVVAGWFSIVACVFSLPSITRVYHRSKYWIDHCTGGLFILLGILLLVER